MTDDEKLKILSDLAYKASEDALRVVGDSMRLASLISEDAGPSVAAAVTATMLTVTIGLTMGLVSESRITDDDRLFYALVLARYHLGSIAGEAAQRDFLRLTGRRYERHLETRVDLRQEKKT